MDHLKFVTLRETLFEAISYLRPTGDMSALNVRCPHCGDSKKQKSKRRGFFLTMDGSSGQTIMYKCHNGGCEFNEAIPAEQYLFRFHKDAYQRYKVNLGKAKVDKNAQAKAEALMAKWQKEAREISTRKMLLANESIRTFEKLDTMTPNNSHVIAYLTKRRIPKDIISDWAWCPPNGTLYANRIIIPYRRKDGNGKFFQARAIDPNTEPRYITRYGVDREIYNADFIDTDQDVFVLEGVIDSLFVKNSIALSGIGTSDRTDAGKFLKSLEKKVWFLDGDLAGAKLALKKLKEGHRVVSWARLRKRSGKTSKDVNDLINEIGKPFIFDRHNLNDFIIEGADGVIEMIQFIKQLEKENK